MELVRQYAALAIQAEREFSDSLTLLSLERVLSRARLKDNVGIAQSVAALEGLDALTQGQAEQIEQVLLVFSEAAKRALDQLPERSRRSLRRSYSEPVENLMRMQAGAYVNLRRWSGAACEVCTMIQSQRHDQVNETAAKRFESLLQELMVTYAAAIDKLREHRTHIANVYAILDAQMRGR